MKANEAPEKIYLNPTQDALTEMLSTKVKGDVEYIRTDVFIEKACEWMRENKDHPFIGCEDPCLSGYLTDEFIEEFKKAMEV